MEISESFNKKRALTKECILALLENLNDELKAKNICGELYLVGGAVMCMAYDARQSTHDIDCVFKPKMEIYDSVKKIARDKGIQEDWINDAVKGFMGYNQEFLDYLELSNLKVKVGSSEYMLAMKIQSSRTDNMDEVNDIKFLLNLLEIKTVEQVENIVSKFYRLDLIKPKCWYLVEELLDE